MATHNLHSKSVSVSESEFVSESGNLACLAAAALGWCLLVASCVRTTAHSTVKMYFISVSAALSQRLRLYLCICIGGVACCSGPIRRFGYRPADQPTMLPQHVSATFGSHSHTWYLHLPRCGSFNSLGLRFGRPLVAWHSAAGITVLFSPTGISRIIWPWWNT